MAIHAVKQPKDVAREQLAGPADHRLDGLVSRDRDQRVGVGAVLGPQLGHGPTAGVGVRLVPCRDVAAEQLVEVTHGDLPLIDGALIVSGGRSGRVDAPRHPVGLRAITITFERWAVDYLAGHGRPAVETIPSAPGGDR